MSRPIDGEAASSSCRAFAKWFRPSCNSFSSFLSRRAAYSPALMERAARKRGASLGGSVVSAPGTSSIASFIVSISLLSPRCRLNVITANVIRPIRATGNATTNTFCHSGRGSSSGRPSPASRSDCPDTNPASPEATTPSSCSRFAMLGPVPPFRQSSFSFFFCSGTLVRCRHSGHNTFLPCRDHGSVHRCSHDSHFIAIVR